MLVSASRIPLSHSFSPFSLLLLSPPLKSLFRHHCRPTTVHRPSHSTSPITTMTSSRQVVEHIVLFKVKPDADPTKINAMVTNLNALNSLNLTLHLTAGPVLRSKCSSLSFTHMLHSRYKSRDKLNSYTVHPEHVSVVTNYVRPVIDDIMAVDWVSNELTGDIVPKSGSALRVSFFKLKEGTGEEDKSMVLNAIGEIKDLFPSIDQVSVGENFSIERAKGYSIASIRVLGGLSDLEALDSDSNAELVNAQKEKVRDLIDSRVVVDYVVPPLAQAAASL